jgi:hypothetical protein
VTTGTRVNVTGNEWKLLRTKVAREMPVVVTPEVVEPTQTQNPQKRKLVVKKASA